MQATLEDDLAATSTSLVPQGCATADWKQATTFVVPGRSYTLTLTNHHGLWLPGTDTLFDDVALEYDDFVVDLQPVYNAADDYVSIDHLPMPLVPGSEARAQIETFQTAGNLSDTPQLTAAVSPTGPVGSIGDNGARASVAIGADAAAGVYTLTVTGTEGTAVHSSKQQLTVVRPGPIVNGGFESGLSGWTVTPGAAGVLNTGCHGGTYCATVDAYDDGTGSFTTLSQVFLAPAGSTSLSLWYKPDCSSQGTTIGPLATLIDIVDRTSAVVIDGISVPWCTSPWVQATQPVQAGHFYQLEFHRPFDSSTPVLIFLDDVTVQ
jgi:hypothetical protein